MTEATKTEKYIWFRSLALAIGILNWKWARESNRKKRKKDGGVVKLLNSCKVNGESGSIFSLSPWNVILFVAAISSRTKEESLRVRVQEVGATKINIPHIKADLKKAPTKSKSYKKWCSFPLVLSWTKLDAENNKL